MHYSVDGERRLGNICRDDNFPAGTPDGPSRGGGASSKIRCCCWGGKLVQWNHFHDAYRSPILPISRLTFASIFNFFFTCEEDQHHPEVRTHVFEQLCESQPPGSHVQGFEIKNSTECMSTRIRGASRNNSEISASSVADITTTLRSIRFVRTS